MKKHVRRYIALYLSIIMFIMLFLPQGTLKVRAIPPSPTNLGTLRGYYTQKGTIDEGEVVWYSFDLDTVYANYWGIVQLIGYQDKGSMKFTVYDSSMNAIMGNYTLSGSHMCEAAFRAEGTATREEFLPRLNRGWTYYIAIEGIGDYDISVYSIDDDYEGAFDKAYAMTIGTTYTGALERSDDIDCFSIKLPNDGLNYEISVYATRKMSTTICDDNDNPMPHTGLNVMRDRQTSEAIFVGSGQTLYFYLTGSGSTLYRIKSSLKGTVSNITNSQVVATAGSKYIYIYTLKKSRVTVTTNKKILGNKKRKVIKQTSKKVTKVKLKRALRAGDEIKVIIEKGRLKKYVKKIKIK